MRAVLIKAALRVNRLKDWGVEGRLFLYLSTSYNRSLEVSWGSLESSLSVPSVPPPLPVWLEFHDHREESAWAFFVLFILLLVLLSTGHRFQWSLSSLK